MPLKLQASKPYTPSRSLILFSFDVFTINQTSYSRCFIVTFCIANIYLHHVHLHSISVYSIHPLCLLAMSTKVASHSVLEFQCRNNVRALGVSIRGSKKKNMPKTWLELLNYRKKERFLSFCRFARSDVALARENSLASQSSFGPLLVASPTSGWLLPKSLASLVPRSSRHRLVLFAGPKTLSTISAWLRQSRTPYSHLSQSSLLNHGGSAVPAATSDRRVSLSLIDKKSPRQSAKGFTGGPLPKSIIKLILKPSTWTRIASETIYAGARPIGLICQESSKVSYVRLCHRNLRCSPPLFFFMPS